MKRTPRTKIEKYANIERVNAKYGLSLTDNSEYPYLINNQMLIDKL